MTTVTFDDTEWDFPASEIAESATLRLSLERIEDLSTSVKRPKRFPIVPLKSTLARAKRELEDVSETNESPAASIRVKPPRKPLQTKTTVVDSHGRTRAAQKVLTPIDATKPTLLSLASCEASVANAKDIKKRKRGDLQPSGQRESKLVKRKG